MPRIRVCVILFCLVGVIAGARAPEPSVTPLQQLFVLKEIKPDLERIGVIWNEDAARKSDLMPQLERASASTGIKIFVSYASSLSDIAPVYRDLVRTNNVQAIWVVDQNDVVVNSRMGRDFLIKNTAGQGLPLLAPADDWVEAGAHLTFFHDGSNLRLKVNKRSADAAALVIPEKYLERTDFLAVN